MIKRFSPTSIGRWSARRPRLAIAIWLLFVVVAVLALRESGSKKLQNGAVGESARGYALMDSHQLGFLEGGGAGASNDLSRAEKLSVPVTLLVLLIAFGAVVASLVPVLLAVTAVVAAFGLLGPISQVFPLDDSVKTVVLPIGMAVGVDYALFYVVRSREERRLGCTSREALERTACTSGGSVVIAGSTVMIAMAACTPSARLRQNVSAPRRVPRQLFALCRTAPRFLPAS